MQRSIKARNHILKQIRRPTNRRHNAGLRAAESAVREFWSTSADRHASKAMLPQIAAWNSIGRYALAKLHVGSMRHQPAAAPSNQLQTYVICSHESH